MGTPNDTLEAGPLLEEHTKRQEYKELVESAIISLISNHRAEFDYLIAQAKREKLNDRS